MRNPRNQHSDPCPLVRDRGLAVHAELKMCHRFEGCRHLRDIPSARLRPFHPLEKNVLFRIAVLVGVKDIATLLENPAGNPRYQSRSVRSVQQSNN
jgi:hypothetical protein